MPARSNPLARFRRESANLSQTPSSPSASAILGSAAEAVGDDGASVCPFDDGAGDPSEFVASITREELLAEYWLLQVENDVLLERGFELAERLLDTQERLARALRLLQRLTPKKRKAS